MPSSPALVEILERAAARDIVVSLSGRHRAVDVLDRAAEISKQASATDCMICSTQDPAEILACLCMSASRLVSVLLVPYYLNRQIPSFARAVGANAVLTREGGVERISAPATAAAHPGEMLLLTSGSTGTPKLVRHKLESLCARIRRPSGESDRVWMLTYLPTSFAGIQVLLTSALAGDLLVQAPGSANEALRSAATNCVTHLSCTPTFFRSLLASGADGDVLPSLRQITLGGEIADQRTLNTATERFPGIRLSHIYATTEAGALFSISDCKEGFPSSWLESGVEGVELRIRERTLCVRSPRSMLGYAGSSAPTGWIDTGDLVRIEGDRVLFVGRRDRRINVGGAKTVPEEVERAIMEVPGVVDAVVRGIPNPLSGESIVAEIVPMIGVDPDHLRDRIFTHIRSRLANHQLPRILHFTPSLTLSPAGKKAASA